MRLRLHFHLRARSTWFHFIFYWNLHFRFQLFKLLKSFWKQNFFIPSIHTFSHLIAWYLLVGLMQITMVFFGYFYNSCKLWKVLSHIKRSTVVNLTIWWWYFNNLFSKWWTEKPITSASQFFFGILQGPILLLLLMIVFVNEQKSARNSLWHNTRNWLHKEWVFT